MRAFALTVIACTLMSCGSESLERAAGVYHIGNVELAIREAAGGGRPALPPGWNRMDTLEVSLDLRADGTFRYHGPPWNGQRPVQLRGRWTMTGSEIDLHVNDVFPEHPVMSTTIHCRFLPGMVMFPAGPNNSGSVIYELAREALVSGKIPEPEGRVIFVEQDEADD